jgi:O-antigen/teichoic acid export membrane protein
MVLIAVVIGMLVLTALAVLCFAAYKIKAESFEFSTAILKLVSFSIKIMSPNGKNVPTESAENPRRHAA